MLPTAITKASQRLRTADAAVARMRLATTFGDFRSEWENFLVAWKAIYTALEQGSKASPQSRQWYGGKKNLRKSDQLLDYLFAARNDLEHGLLDSITIESEGANMLVKLPDPATRPADYEIIYNRDPVTGDMTFSGSDGKPLDVVCSSPAGVTLTQVKRRDGSDVWPPHQHLGEFITEISPLVISGLAITYMESLIKEAAALPAA